ncbi:MAG: ornithine carbamoyltransferase, partial [Nanoarchaeota archaeon]|nr:ornithine carbamoyltransferase [Nanoarchaeota archaeon]
MKHFLSIDDLKVEDIKSIFNITERLKSSSKTLLRIGQQHNMLNGRTMAMIFAKPSTRTRVSFEVAMQQLGGNAIFLGMNDIQLGRGESIKDTAQVLSRYVHVIMARLFAHEDLLELARYSSVPVINGLTDLLHPCQITADMYTLQEKFGKLEGLKLAYVGDGENNITHSLINASKKLGIEMTVGCPTGYKPRKEILEGSNVKVVKDPVQAVTGADVVYTDTWVSMGDKKAKKRIKDLKPYQVNSKLISHAKPKAVVMHDLPAHRGNEITDEVMDGDQSIILDQAENRLHVQKGILAWLIG